MARGDYRGPFRFSETRGFLSHTGRGVYAASTSGNPRHAFTPNHAYAEAAKTSRPVRVVSKFARAGFGLQTEQLWRDRRADALLRVTAARSISVSRELRGACYLNSAAINIRSTNTP